MNAGFPQPKVEGSRCTTDVTVGRESGNLAFLLIPRLSHSYEVRFGRKFDVYTMFPGCTYFCTSRSVYAPGHCCNTTVMPTTWGELG